MERFLHPQLIQDSQSIKADTTQQKKQLTLGTVCTWLVPIATVLWVMAEISISRAQGSGWASCRAWQTKYRAEPKTAFGLTQPLLLLQPNPLPHGTPHWSSPCPAANPKLQSSIDLCYLQTAWCTTAEQQGREVKTKQHRARNLTSAQI